jgi:uncharacterized protein YbjT (DUF2867 family)
MILITGAAGKTGQAVIRALSGRGQDVCALVRTREQAESLRKLEVKAVVAGDMTDQDVMDRAAAGAAAVYHICPNMHPDEIKIGEIVIRSAQTSGIEHFVYHSVLHPQIEAMPHHWHKMRAEEMLLESQLSFTIIQPAAYMQNLLANWNHIAGQGIYAVPYAVDTRISMVDLRDVAEVAAKVLVEEGHEGAVYELCGPQALSQREVAAILSVELKRPVKAETVPIDIWEAGARKAGLSDFAVETLVQMFLHYEQFNFWGNPNVLSWLLGRPPATFAQFLQRVIQDGRQD